MCECRRLARCQLFYPVSDRSIQRAFQVVVGKMNLAKSGIRLHTLRHSDATHLLGDGRGTLKYPAAYVFRVAVTENRITECG